ncbi:MAG: YczE/YyaS/YitT family protein [Actinomycetota bacterium]
MLASTAESPLARRLGTLAVGLLLVGCGVAMMIRGEIGVAPYDVLTTGIASASGIEIGVAAMLLPLAFAMLGWALGRKPGPGTVLAVLLVGPILGAALRLLPEHEAMPPRLALFAIGFLLVAAGITAVIIAEIGPGPAEIVMLAVHDKGYPLASVRTGIELVCVATGWAIGGQVGVGTVIVALLIGPMLRWMLAATGYGSDQAARAAEYASPAL